MSEASNEPDCLQQMPEHERDVVYHALSGSSLPEAVAVMKGLNVCDECILYYTAASLLTFWQRSGVPGLATRIKLENAFEAVYGDDYVRQADADELAKG